MKLTGTDERGWKNEEMFLKPVSQYFSWNGLFPLLSSLASPMPVEIE